MAEKPEQRKPIAVKVPVGTRARDGAADGDGGDDADNDMRVDGEAGALLAGDGKGAGHTRQDEFSELVAAKLAEFAALVSANQLAAGLELMLNVEKKTRLGEDAFSTTKILVTIVQTLYERKEYEMLDQYLVLLSKRRGQLKEASKGMVDEAFTRLDSIQDKATRLRVLDTLRTITEGKIHLEIERANLTRYLARFKQSEGDIVAAAKILQEVQVETYGSMTLEQRFDFILEQMTLCLDSDDYTRAVILSRKISDRALADPKLQSFQDRYFALMIRYHLHEVHYLDVVRALLRQRPLEHVKADAARLSDVVTATAVFMCLAKREPEQLDMMRHLAADKYLDEHVELRDMLNGFLTTELLMWPQFRKQIFPIVNSVKMLSGKAGSLAWENLELRVVEHNIHVLSQYYSQITTARFADFLGRSPEDAEKSLCEMVVDGSVYARIDRPAGKINFVRPTSSAELLNNWSRNITQLLSLVEDTVHLIHKEEMLHA